MKRFCKNEEGLTIVEATIVVPIVLMVIFLLLYLGFIMYQKTIITVFANDTAASIAQVYATPAKDPFVGYAKSANLMSEQSLYRSLTNAINPGNKSGLSEENKKKATWYFEYRLLTKQLYKPSANVDVVAEYENVPGTLLQNVICVKVTANYDVPFVRFFGVNNSKLKISAEGRAQCMDMLDYASILSLFNSVANDVGDSAAQVVVEGSGFINDFVDFVKKFLTNSSL